MNTTPFTPYTPEQTMGALKAQMDATFGLTAKAFESVEKLVELNLQTAKTSLAEAAETAQTLLSVKDMQELLAIQAGLMQPAAEKAAAYGRHLSDIFSGASAEAGKLAEATMADGQKQVLALVDNAVKNAPAGSESAVALVKSAVAAATNAYESVHKAAKQASEAVEANLTSMTNSAVKAASSGSKARKSA